MAQGDQVGGRWEETEAEVHGAGATRVHGAEEHGAGMHGVVEVDGRTKAEVFLYDALCGGELQPCECQTPPACKAKEISMNAEEGSIEAATPVALWRKVGEH